VKLDPKERKLLLLAYDSVASVGESLNALRVLFKNWLIKYPDGHALLKDLKSGEVREKVVYRNAESPDASTVLPFGMHRGSRLDEIPADYLLWVLDNFDALHPSLRTAIEKYLEQSE
jgi:hypothetical protein